jgi:uridine monophosphate synthetase
MMPEFQELALALHRIGALQFGEFTLKSGLKSPFYVDLRLLISYPDVLELCGSVLAGVIAPLQFDRLAAIPYAGLPIGTALALKVKRPMIFPRKEKKEYGMGKHIEGLYNAGDRVLVIDDLITRGDAKLEAIAPLRDAGLVVSDIAVLLDRQSGGVQTLAAAGICVHAALRLTEMLDVLQGAGKLDAGLRLTIDTWLGENSL